MRIKYYTALILVGMIFISCDDSFSPKAPYDERYSLNCIIRGDTSFHVATLYKNYDVPNLDPYENKDDTFINGAFIRMWRGNDEIYVFKDSTMPRTDTSRFNTDINYYFIKDFVPQEGDSLEIEALLPNGRRLFSHTKIPQKVKRNEEASDMEIIQEIKDNLRTQWIIKNQDQVYLPRLIIDYFVEEDGINIRQKKVIPWKKLQDGININYIYPAPSRDYLIDYEMNLKDESMEDISKNELVKSKYTIISLELELSILDVNLSTYYFTVGLEGNSFAAGLGEGDYTNIENGFGIFGSFYTQQFKIKVSKGYANSFGYNLYE